jgi:hypothetical protein
MAKPHLFPKAEVMDALRHAGYSQELIEEIEPQLSDPVNYRRDGSLLSRYGITFDQLNDRLGGSP